MRQSLIKELHDGHGIEFPLTFDRLPQQTAFVNDWEHPFQGYGGGVANGKTSALCYKAWLLSILFPHNRGFIGRWDGKDLRQTTMAEFFALCPDGMFEKKNDQLGYLKFKREYGGSEILYGDLKEKPKSLNLGWFAIDQAEEVPEERFTDLVERWRERQPLYDGNGQQLVNARGEPVFIPRFALVAFNPEGTASWIWRFFHPDSKEKKAGYQLYEASTYDALQAGFIDQSYVDQMLAVFPEAARKRYILGSWDIFAGRIFPQFEHQTHRLPAFEMPKAWTLYETIDHGLINPTACGWWAYGERCLCGQFTRVLIDEHYEGDGKPVAYHAAVIKNRRTQFDHPVSVSYLDSACWARNQSSGEAVFSIRDEYVKEGIVPVPGAKNWDVGYSRIAQGLERCPYNRHPLTDELGAPHIFYTARCRHYEREMLGYQWKKMRGTVNRNTPDEPIDHDDHLIDGQFYLEASWPGGAQIPPPKKRNALEIVHDLQKAYDPLASVGATGRTWMSV